MRRLSDSYRTNSAFLIPEKRRPLRVIGINSGTSCDGVDIALIQFSPGRMPRMTEAGTYRYPRKLRESILSAGEPGCVDGERWMQLDSELGKLIAKFTNDLISGLKPGKSKPDFIASHGHTVRHLPGKRGHSLTLQIGDPAQIAALTGFPVISDFRKSDIAAGGQGAPLSPILHQRLFASPTRFRAVVNIGGIANITVLPPGKSGIKPFAADCGPGNMAIDKTMDILLKRKYDMYGRTALRGAADMSLVNRIMRQSFFRMPPPKSTGRELFGMPFVRKIIHQTKNLSPQDIVATVSEITVRAMANFIIDYSPAVKEVYLCGGGAKNGYIVRRLKDLLSDVDVHLTSNLGYDPDFIEAMLWAYLGYCFAKRIRIDSKRFTGAKKTYIPGRLCLP